MLDRELADALVGVGRDQHVDRVADGVDADEHQDRDRQHHDEGLQQPLDDEAEHRAPLRIRPSRPASAPASPRRRRATSPSCPRRRAGRARRSCRRRATSFLATGSSRLKRLMSIIGFCSAGIATPGSRVQGKFSSQDACEATGSISFAFAQVFGAFHQLCHFTWQPRLRSSHSRTAPCAGDVAAVPVHDQDAAEAGAHDAVEDVLHQRAQRRDLAA